MAARTWVDFDQDVEYAVITHMPPRETIDGIAYLVQASISMTKRDRRTFSWRPPAAS